MPLLDLLTSNPKILLTTLNLTPPKLLTKIAEIKTISDLKTSYNNTPAVRKHFEANHINIKDIKNIKDLSKVPLTSKENYFNVYQLPELISITDLKHSFSICRSSGYSGKAYYWPSFWNREKSLENYAKFGLNYLLNLDQKSTLIVISFAMGTWTAGETISRTFKQIAASPKCNTTVINPGTNVKETLEIIKDLNKYYDQILICGYPPFLSNLVDEGENENYDWKQKKTFILTGGEGFTEEWRDKMSRKLNHNFEKADSGRIYSAYGTAENGMTGCLENPLTILTRRLARDNEDLKKVLFGDNHNLPMLFQYNPLDIFIEQINNEIIFTQYSAIPLIRYNIGDRGGIHSFSKVVKVLNDFGYDPYTILKNQGYPKSIIINLPFMYIFGRTDGTISLDGANIYPEDIKSIIDDPQTIEKQMTKAIHSSLESYLKEIPYPNNIATEMRKKFPSFKIILEKNIPLSQIVDTFKIIPYKGRFHLSFELKEKHKYGKEIIPHIEKAFYYILTPLLYEKSNGYHEIFLEKLKSANPQIYVTNWGTKEFKEDHDKIKKRYIPKIKK